MNIYKTTTFSSQHVAEILEAVSLLQLGVSVTSSNPHGCVEYAVVVSIDDLPNPFLPAAYMKKLGENKIDNN